MVQSQSPDSPVFVRTLFLTTFLKAITRRYNKNWLFTINLYYWSYCQQSNTYCKDGTPESRVETDVEFLESTEVSSGEMNWAIRAF